MSRELWKLGVQWKDRRTEGTLRHSQLVVGYGPGAMVDFVDDAAMIAGLSWWARGEEVVEDRLLAMLRRQEGYEHVQLFAPPQGDAHPRRSRRASGTRRSRFPEWFVCQNERCWEDADQPRDARGTPAAAAPGKPARRRQAHTCKGGKGRPARSSRSDSSAPAAKGTSTTSPGSPSSTGSTPTASGPSCGSTRPAPAATSRTSASRAAGAATTCA